MGLRGRKPNDGDFWPKVYCQWPRAGVVSLSKAFPPAAITGTGVKTPKEREAQRRARRPAAWSVRTGERHKRPRRVDRRDSTSRPIAFSAREAPPRPSQIPVSTAAGPARGTLGAAAGD